MIFKEENGQGSMRRVLAFMFAVSAILLATGALFFAQYGWIVFIPSIVFCVASIVLLFFTTWADITGAIQAARK
jgi:hypothetical protein